MSQRETQWSLYAERLYKFVAFLSKHFLNCIIISLPAIKVQVGKSKLLRLAISRGADEVKWDAGSKVIKYKYK